GAAVVLSLDPEPGEGRLSRSLEFGVPPSGRSSLNHKLGPRERVTSNTTICSFELAWWSELKDNTDMLTERQRSILDFIQREQREKGMTPSTREIQNHFGFASQTSVMQYIAALERKGFLDRHARKARALITPAMKVRITDIPIYGQIPAGMSALTEQSVEGHVSLDTRSAKAGRPTISVRLNISSERAMFISHGCGRQNYRSTQSAGGALPASFVHDNEAINYRLTFS